MSSDAARTRLTREARAIPIGGRRRRVTLAGTYWACLKEIAAAEGKTIEAIVADVAAHTGGRRVAAGLEVFVVGYLRLARR